MLPWVESVVRNHPHLLRLFAQLGECGEGSWHGHGESGFGEGFVGFVGRCRIAWSDGAHDAEKFAIKFSHSREIFLFFNSDTKNLKFGYLYTTRSVFAVGG